MFKKAFEPKCDGYNKINTTFTALVVTNDGKTQY